MDRALDEWRDAATEVALGMPSGRARNSRPHFYGPSAEAAADGAIRGVRRK